MPISSPINDVLNPLARAVMKKIVTSNTKENKAVKQAKGYQSNLSDTAMSLKDRIAQGEKANEQWTLALNAANGTYKLVNKLWSYAIPSGDLNWDSNHQAIYPLVNINTWSGTAGQEKLMGGPAQNRAHNYAVILAANKTVIKNLKAILGLGNLTWNFGQSQPDTSGLTDLNGLVNVNSSAVPTTVNASPGLNPNTVGVPVPGAEDPSGTGAVDPVTGAPLAADDPAGPWTFERLALLGAAAAAGIFWYTTRR